MRLLFATLACLAFTATADAASYYVSAEGNDSNSGTSPAQAFATPARGMTALGNGDKLYLRAGDTFQLSGSMRLSRSGTAGNPVLIGAYFVENGVTEHRVYDNRPVIDGGQSVPTCASYDGLVHVTGQHTEVRDIVIRNSCGAGIRIFETANAKIDNVVVDWSYYSAIQVFKSSDVEILNFRITQFGQGGRFFGVPQYPAGISIRTGTNVRVAGGLVHEGWGEGINSFFGSANTVIEDNIVTAYRNVGIYVDSTQGADVRRNMVIGTRDSEYHRYGANTWNGPGIAFNNESYQFPEVQAGRNYRVTNNLVVGTVGGVVFYGQHESTDWQNVLIAHNTFIDNEAAISGHNGRKFTSTQIRNNIFLSLSGNTADYGQAITLSGITWSHNYWSDGAPHTAMRGAGDIYGGGVQLNKMSGWAALDSYDQVGWQDFAPVAGSSTVSAGTAALLGVVPTDYRGTAWRSPPSIGAIELGAPPVDPPDPEGPIAVGALTLVSKGTPVNSAEDATSLMLNVGEHEPGDYLFAVCVLSQSAMPTREWIEDPTDGYVPLPELSANPMLTNGRGVHIQVALRIAQSSNEPGRNCRTTVGGPAQDGAVIGGNTFVVRSAGDLPIEIHNAAVSETNNPGNIVTPPLAISRDSALVIAIGAVMADWSTALPCCGFTTLYESSTLAGGDLGHTIAYELQSEATSIPASQFTIIDENRLFSPEGSTIFALTQAQPPLGGRQFRRGAYLVIPLASGSVLIQNTPGGQMIARPPDPPPPDPDPVSELKWFPGHGFRPQGNASQSNRQAWFDSVQSQLQNRMTDPVIKFAHLLYAWGSIELSEGNYDWAPIHGHLDWLWARGHRGLVVIETKCFSTNCGSLAPSDLPSMHVVPANEGRGITMHRAAVIDRMITFAEAFAEEFDAHPAVTGVMIGGQELCPSYGQVGAPSDYSTGALLTQMGRLQDELALIFEHTVIFGPVNCDVGSNAQMLLEKAYQSTCNNPNVVTKIGRGGPDVHMEPGRILFEGGGNAVRDYRGILPQFGIVSAPNLGGKDNILPLSNIIQNHILAGQFTHVAWIATDPDAPWSTIISAIKDLEPDIQETVSCD